MTNKDSSFLWKLTDHCCRSCFGRVLSRLTVGGNNVYRCADCGVEEEGRNETSICACGIRVRNDSNTSNDEPFIDAGIRCTINSSKNVSCPSEIVAESFSGSNIPERPEYSSKHDFDDEEDIEIE